MPHKNAHAGCCYKCGSYVASGAGQLLKYRVAGHKYSIRCTACGLAAEKLSTAPTKASMSENTARLYCLSLRKQLLNLLSDPDMPADKVRPGQVWLEEKLRPAEVLHAFQDRLLEIRNEARAKRLAAA